MKAVFSGFVIGAACAACAVALWFKAHPAPPPAATPAGPTAAPSAIEDLQALRNRADALRAEIARLEMPAGATADPSSLTSSDRRRSMSACGKSFLAAFRRWPARGAAVTRCRMDFMLVTGEIAERSGISPREAQMAPDGILSLLVGMREAHGEPVTDAEKAAIEDILSRYRAAWEDWLKRCPGQTTLERANDVLSMNLKARQELYAAFPGTARDAVRENLGYMDFLSPFSSCSSVETSRANADLEIAKRWAGDLGLDATAAATLRTAAAEYLRDLEKSRSQAQGDPGESDWESAELEVLGPMVRAQQRIRTLVPLDAGQAARLSGWMEIYEPWYGTEGGGDGK